MRIAAPGFFLVDMGSDGFEMCQAQHIEETSTRPVCHGSKGKKGQIGKQLRVE